jgi:ligand-binding sensor domain-containing protein
MARANLWAAANAGGLLEVTRAGEIRRYGEEQGLPFFVNQSRKDVIVSGVAVDGDGGIWVGAHSGLCKLRQQPAADGGIVERVYTSELSRNSIVECLYVTRSGRLWVGTRNGASEWTGDPRRPFRHWGAAEGITDTDTGVEAIGEDGAGNLWIATGDEGVKRIARNGLVTYRPADGLARQSISTFTEGRDGELLAVSLRVDSLDLNRFEGDHFTAIHPALPGHIRWLGWGSGSTAFQDREGDWWLATGEGLCRYEGRGGAAGLARTHRLKPSTPGRMGSPATRFSSGRNRLKSLPTHCRHGLPQRP